MTKIVGFAAQMEAAGFDPASFAAALQELGDPSHLPAINRRIRRWMAGDAQASGEAVALLTLLARVNRAIAPLSAVLPTKGDVL